MAERNPRRRADALQQVSCARRTQFPRLELQTVGRRDLPREHYARDKRLSGAGLVPAKGVRHGREDHQQELQQLLRLALPSEAHAHPLPAQ